MNGAAYEFDERNPPVAIALAIPNCDWESSVVAALTNPGLTVDKLGHQVQVRRCLGLPELLTDVGREAVAAAFVAPNFPHLTAEMVARLQSRRTRIVAVCHDEPAERHARQLGFVQTLPIEAGNPEHTARRMLTLVTNQPAARDTGMSCDAGGPDAALAFLGTPEGSTGGCSPGLTADSLPSDRLGNAIDAAKADPQGAMIAFWGPAGAPGRTALALAVAHTIAGRGIETMIVDADERAPGIAAALGLLDTDSGLALAAGLADRGALNTHSLARHARQLNPHWRVLTGLNSPDDWHQVPGAAAGQLLRCCRALCDFVIVDVGAELERDDELLHDQFMPRRDAAAIAACESADVVVAVCGPEPPALARLCSRLAVVRQAAPTARLVIAVNRARAALGSVATEREIRRVLADAADAQVEFIPDDQRTFDAATCRQVLPTERDPRSPFGVAVAGLVDTLLSGFANKVAPHRRA